MRPLLVFLVFLLGIASAHADSPTSAQIEQLMQSVGLQQQLSQIPEALGSAGKQQSGLAAGFVKPLITALQEVFKPAEMQRIMREDLLKRLDVPTLLDAMQWYTSSDGKSIVDAEQSLMQPAVIAKVSKAIQQQSSPALTPARKTLLLNIDNATQASDSALDMMLNVQAAFLSGFSTLITPDQKTSFESLLSNFAGSKAQYKQTIQDQLLLQQAVLMEPIPDETLEKFHQFALTPSGKKLFVAINQSLNHTIRTVAHNIPEAVAKMGNENPAGAVSNTP